MIERVPDYDVLEKCIKDILSLIKPVEDDRSKRLSAIQELEISIQSVPALRGATAKPFGSFLSNLYSKSGDLDLSVQLMHSSNLQISKKRKQNLLRELRRALQIRGVAGYLDFIPHARVPVLQYVSNCFGISCDLSIDNYPGRIKSRIFYWINTLDERFSDMVLLVKEWAKAQNINDPKTGTLNSYSLCLLVLFHFQTCEPAILPPLKDIYEGNITEDFADVTLYNAQHLDEVCAANITKFQSQNKEENNESSLCHLLATFFHKFSNISDLSSDVISTYTGQFEKIQDNPSRKAKSYSLFVEDPVERPDNAARAVGMKGLIQISHAFKDANRKFVSLEHTDRNDLLEMLCTPGGCSNLGGRVIAKPYANTPQRTNQHARSMGRGSAKPSDSRGHHVDRGFTGSRAVHNPRQTTGQSGQYQNHNLSQVHSNATVYQTPGQYQNHNLPEVHASTIGHQTTGQPGPYQNHNRQQAYTALHQAAGLYQNQSHPQVHAAWIQTGGPYQNRNNQQMYNTGHQTAGPYQNHSDPQGYTSGGLYQTPGQYQNFYNQTPLYMTRHQTEGPYQNQQARKYSPAPQPVLGGLQNGPAWNSLSQASSSHATWQERSQQHS